MWRGAIPPPAKAGGLLAPNFMNEKCQKYCEMTRKLQRILDGDSAEADTLLDEMDVLWDSMTEDEQGECEKFVKSICKE